LPADLGLPAGEAGLRPRSWLIHVSHTTDPRDPERRGRGRRWRGRRRRLLTSSVPGGRPAKSGSRPSPARRADPARARRKAQAGV